MYRSRYIGSDFVFNGRTRSTGVGVKWHKVSFEDRRRREGKGIWESVKKGPQKTNSTGQLSYLPPLLPSTRIMLRYSASREAALHFNGQLTSNYPKNLRECLLRLPEYEEHCYANYPLIPSEYPAAFQIEWAVAIGFGFILSVHMDVLRMHTARLGATLAMAAITLCIWGYGSIVHRVTFSVVTLTRSFLTEWFMHVVLVRGFAAILFTLTKLVSIVGLCRKTWSSGSLGLVQVKQVALQQLTSRNTLIVYLILIPFIYGVGDVADWLAAAVPLRLFVNTSLWIMIASYAFEVFLGFLETRP